VTSLASTTSIRAAALAAADALERQRASERHRRAAELAKAVNKLLAGWGLPFRADWEPATDLEAVVVFEDGLRLKVAPMDLLDKLNFTYEVRCPECGKDFRETFTTEGVRSGDEFLLRLGMKIKRVEADLHSHWCVKTVPLQLDREEASS